MSQLLISGLGAGIGFAIGGPTGAQWGWMGGSVAGALLNPGEDVKTFGPRANNLKGSTSTYGETLDRGWGTFPSVGKLIWSPDIDDHTHHTESGGKGGGTTQESEYYTYTCNAAWAFCEGPVAAIRKIWFNSELVYDASVGNDNVVKEGLSIRIYLGTETQLPDGKIQSIEGESATSAHRGVCYIVVNDLPLGNYGNARPTSVRAEVVRESPLLHTSVDIHANGYQGTRTQHDPITGWTYYQSSTITYVYDGPTDTLLASYTNPTMINDNGNQANITIEGMFNGRMFGHSNWDLNNRIISQIDPMSGAVIGFTRIYRDFNVARMDVSENWVTYPITVSTESGESVAILDPELLIDKGGARVDDEGNFLGSNEYDYLVTFTDAGGSHTQVEPDTGYIWIQAELELALVIPVLNEEWLAGLGLPKWTFTHTTLDLSTLDFYDISRVFVYDPYTQGLIIQQHSTTGGALPIGTHRVECATRHNLATMSVVASNTDSTTDSYNWMGHGLSGDGLYFMRTDTDELGEYSTVDLTKNRDIAFTGLSGTMDQESGIFPSKKIAYGSEFPGDAMKHTWDRVNPGGIDLQTLTENICEDHSLLPGEPEASDLAPQTVRGFVVSDPTTGRAQIESLMGGFFYDAAEIDKQIIFRFRDRASSKTILEEDLAAHRPGSEVPQKFPMLRQEEYQIPQAVHVTYISREREYEPNIQPSTDLVTNTADIMKMQYGIVMSDDEGAQCAERWMQTLIAERFSSTISLSIKHLELDPTDIISIPRNGELHDMRIVGIDWSPPGLFKYSLRTYDQESFNTVVSGIPGIDISTSIERLARSGFFMVDGPSLSDLHDDAGFYAGFYPLENVNTWPGGALNRRLSPANEWQSIQQFFAESTVGYTTGELASYDRWTIWDHTNTLNINILNEKTLEDKTELEVYNGANALYFPWSGELIQFTNKTLEGDGTYTISGLLRGRRGTDWAIELHTPTEPVVLLDITATYRVPDVVGNIGKTFDFKAVTIGRSITETNQSSWTQQGRAIIPYSPVNITIVREDNNDLTITGIRRARLTNEWLDSIDVPLDETREEWDIEIYLNDVLTDTQRVVGPLLYVYTEADQQEHNNGKIVSAELEVHIYQISDRVGRGYVAISDPLVEPLWTDFTEYSIGESPPGDWTKHGQNAGSNTAWTIQSDKHLVSSRISNGVNMLNWQDTLIKKNVEIFIRIKTNLRGFGQGGQINNGVIFRCSDLSAFPTGYQIGFEGESGYPRIAIYSGATLATDTGFQIDDDTTWYRVRARIEGDSIKMKYWEDGDSEPVAWGLEVTDSSYSNAGYTSLFGGFHFNKDPERFNYFAIAYDGETAPGP